MSVIYTQSQIPNVFIYISDTTAINEMEKFKNKPATILSHLLLNESIPPCCPKLLLINVTLIPNYNRLRSHQCPHPYPSAHQMANPQYTKMANILTATSSFEVCVIK